MLKTIISPVEYLRFSQRKYIDPTAHINTRDQVDPPPSVDDCVNGEGQDRSADSYQTQKRAVTPERTSHKAGRGGS